MTTRVVADSTSDPPVHVSAMQTAGVGVLEAEE